MYVISFICYFLCLLSSIGVAAAIYAAVLATDDFPQRNGKKWNIERGIRLFLQILSLMKRIERGGR